VTEIAMVERSHTAGWLPQVYGPLRQMRDKIADWFAPKADGAMTEDSYGISMELPGVAVDDVQIVVQDGTLTVQGEKRLDHTESGQTYFFSEREYGAFQRSFRLPPDAAGDRIDAVFKNGVLEVRIPKLQPDRGDGRRVSIRTE
jgi:HSP20 family protein